MSQTLSCSNNLECIISKGSKLFPEVNDFFVQKTRKNQGYKYGINKWKKKNDNPSESKPAYHQKWRHNEQWYDFYDGDLCLTDNAITHTILKENKYFEYLILTKVNVTTISGPTDMIKGSGKANIVLPNNTRLSIKDALYSHESRRNLLSFKDIRANGYHIETTDEDRKQYFKPKTCT